MRCVYPYVSSSYLYKRGSDTVNLITYVFTHRERYLLPGAKINGFLGLNLFALSFSKSPECLTCSNSKGVPHVYLLATHWPNPAAEGANERVTGTCVQFDAKNWVSALTARTWACSCNAQCHSANHVSSIGSSDWSAASVPGLPNHGNAFERLRMPTQYQCF